MLHSNVSALTIIRLNFSMHTRDEKLQAFGRILDVLDELREKCPWDAKQTIESIRPLTIEETYELADAITDKNMEGIKEELGDLLLHVVFYSKLGEEAGAFNYTDVANGVCDKLIYRHPHVFSTEKVKDAEQVLQNKAIDDFIDSKIKSTYIVIDPMFEDCVFERDGWYEKFRK